ncbi:MAG: hypothetical protein JO141_15715 [Bradyrhizobium sp.]|nr:hypothetical protein [Bradyrhizobium sp.]
MERIEYLREQIARCERLTKSVMDELTVERLLALAAQCREELATLVQECEFAR